jgi:uncharacterized protein YcfJ
MKRLFWTCVTIAVTLSAPAQLFSPESLSGAFWGSMIGGVVGGDCHNGFSGEGAAIGAGVGLLAGAITGEARRNYYGDPQPYTYAPAPAVSAGYGYRSSGSSAYVYYAPNYYTAPGYYYRPTRPNYAVGGTLLGAASGALIGAGNEQAGKGAAIGAAAGLVLGSVAEIAARNHEEKATQVTQPNPANYPQPPTEPQVEQPVPASATQDPAPKTQDAFNQIQSKPCPTSTYYWTTPPPQIADAPRVPDAPRF